MSINTYPKFPFKLPLLLDGSTGTALMRAGMPAGSSTERWVLDNPDVLVAIQNAYRSVGSDAVYTPTFGANRPTLERAFEDDNTEVSAELIADFNRRLAALSIDNSTVTDGAFGGKRTLSGGDMSPTGLFIEPFGDTPFEEIVDIYREQAKALEAAGVDFFVSETNINLAEARAAVIAIREVSDKPIFVTVTVDEEGRTLSGDSLLSCLLTLSELGISAFGTNCSHGPDKMLELLTELVPYSLALGIPLIAKPNAGLPHEDADGSRRFDLDAESFAAYAPKLLEAGITILGGCCGTDFEYIKLLRGEIDRLEAELDYSKIVPADVSSLACTNREVCKIDVKSLEPIAADEEFFDNACMAEEAILVTLADEEAADIFIENAPMLTVPCAVCGNPAAIAKAKRRYNGRLLVI